MKLIIFLMSVMMLLQVLGCREGVPDAMKTLSDVAVQQDDIPDVIDFNFHVRPILSDKCFKCHGPDKNKIEAGLSLATRHEAFLPLESDTTRFALVAGDVQKSVMVDRITTEDASLLMPPPESNLSLTAYEIAVLKKWIAQGAEWKEHWAFDPISNPTPPESAKAIHPIDKFIEAKISTSGLPTNGAASPNHLLRRLAFDITGLPPTVEEVKDFEAKPTEERYQYYVDKYLSSVAYAENITAQWLDLARYADTHGYQDDLERTMWPWRDWVINAFDKNMPYDQFVQWQLAGDMMPDASREQLLATGFNRNHKITQEGGVIPEEYRVEYVADRAQTFGKAFLGLSYECARCHDHKYDPISQKDFYSLYAFFNNVPEKGLIEQYGAIPEPYMTLSKEEMAKTLTFINNMDTVEEVHVLVMKEDPSLRKAYVLDRGAYDKPKEEVQPDTPDFIASFDGYNKDRLGLGEWLFAKENPLTSRVFVNRVWMMLFGKGIVETPDDFGAQGALPTHPELLDHLSYKFMQEGWDIKALIKYIVSSDAYKRSSIELPEHRALDPQNKLYARGQRMRLTAEKIIDHALASSGLLVQKVGGPSVKPYQPPGLWEEVTGGGGGSTAAYIVDKGDKQYRRSLYTFWKRTVPPPTMMTFDAATRDFCMVKRERTSTPLQALTLLNNPRIIEASRHMAYKALKSCKSTEECIQMIFMAYTSRLPNHKELASLTAYYKTEVERFGGDLLSAEAYLAIGDSPQQDVGAIQEVAALALVANTIINLDEAITRS